VLATVMALAKKIKKTAVVSGVCDGFIGNRMIEQYSRQAGFLLDEGCTPAQVDKAVEKFGFAMGPVPHGRPGRQRHRLGHPQAPRGREAGHALQQDRRPAVRDGPLRPEDGAGWYDYQAGKRDAIPAPVVVEMIEKHRAALGITPRKISDDEIVHRLVYALVNEGAKILEEGIASKASDIDMVYLTGYGFPLHRGGPMCYADTVGLFNVVQAMKRFAANPLDDAAFWQPAPLLAKLAAEGKSFS
jgi:3-hydroxyacyl-CoA dehydrogenase